jgi:uncharacterized protein (TIGR03435 family)
MTSFISPRELLAMIGDHLWQSTLFAAAVAAVAMLLNRHSAALRYWVWFVASAKFLVPVAALVAVGGYTSWRSVDVVPYREGPVLIETVGQPFTGESIGLRTPSPRAAADTTVMNWLPTALFVLWAAGAVFFLLRSLLHWYRIHTIARDAVPMTEGRDVEILRALERAGDSATPLPLRCTDSFLEPGIFGIVRPVLLWPRAIGERLTDQQLQAVMAHELCHLRRGDNLAALFHLVVQTVFWCHPLVWWIGAQLITQRERACDEEVIRRGNEREAYAESILKTCQFFVESPLACVSGVTGSDLKKRIEEIMTKDTVSAPGALKRALLTAAGVVVFIAPVTVGALNPPPQTRDVPAPATLPAFEEVSVRPNVTTGPGGRGGGAMQPGRYVAQNLTLKNIIRRAFGAQGTQGPNSGIDLLEQQVAGDAEWVATDKWNVIATTPQATQPPQMRLMMQRMLAERFNLRAHWEKRELPVYILSMARADRSLGPGLRRTPDEECQKAKAEGPPPMPEAQPGGPPPQLGLPNCGAISFGPGQLVARGASMAWLAQTLVTVPVITGIDRPVLDGTNLQGNYGFQLKFAPAQAVNPDPERPHLVTALNEQLGLKLDATQAPVDVLVIDSVERPTPN